MVLGIRVEFDRKSVRDASKQLNKGTKKGVSQGINSGTGAIAGAIAGEEMGTGGKSKKKGGAFAGAALGGLVGAIIGSLEPIKELLSVIGGILKIALVPVLMLFKPFLILFLKVGIKLMKMFTGEGAKAQKEAIGTGKGVQLESAEGSAGELIQGFKDKFFGWLDNLFNIDSISTFVNYFLAFGKIFISGLGNVFFGFLDVLGGLWDLIVGIFTGNWELMLQGILKIFTGLIDIFIGLVKIVVGFVGLIGTIFLKGLSLLWDGLKFLGGLGVKLFDSIVDTIKSGLKVLANIGSWIKDKILGFFGGGGGKETSVNDALITSNGDVVKFHPDDNIMAFKDFSTVASAGSGQGNSVNITVQGSVWSGDDLAEVVAKKLNESSRGGTTNY